MNKKLLPMVAFPVIFGSLALQRTLARPRLAELASIDIVSLLAAGACFGIALMGLIMVIRKKV